MREGAGVMGGSGGRVWGGNAVARNVNMINAAAEVKRDAGVFFCSFWSCVRPERSMERRRRRRRRRMSDELEDDAANRIFVLNPCS